LLSRRKRSSVDGASLVSFSRSDISILHGVDIDELRLGVENPPGLDAVERDQAHLDAKAASRAGFEVTDVHLVTLHVMGDDVDVRLAGW